MEIVQIRSFSGPYFLTFGLNTEIYGVNLRIQSKHGPEKTPYLDNFYTKSGESVEMNIVQRFLHHGIFLFVCLCLDVFLFFFLFLFLFFLNFFFNFFICINYSMHSYATWKSLELWLMWCPHCELALESKLAKWKGN